MTKDLKEKAIDIKGKQYVLVSDRILYFNEAYPKGSIATEELPATKPKMVKFKATVVPDVEQPNRVFTGHSQATWGDGLVNRTAALENAETSAIGRALAMMGIGVIDSIASVDELVKAKATPVTQAAQARQIPQANLPLSKTEEEMKAVVDESVASPGEPADDRPAFMRDYTCAHCGAPAVFREGVSKAGKSYRAIFCSTGEKSHAEWL